MVKIFVIFAMVSFTAPQAFAYGQEKGEYVSGRAVSERDDINLCAGYISNALANRLKPLAQKDANSPCRSGRAVRTSGWDVDCVNGYTVVGADFTCR